MNSLILFLMMMDPDYTDVKGNLRLSAHCEFPSVTCSDAPIIRLRKVGKYENTTENG